MHSTVRTYTAIENDSRDIMNIVTIDKRETKRNSVIMEKEGFIKTMDALLPHVYWVGSTLALCKRGS